MPFVAEGSGRAARIVRVLCGRKKRAFGALPYQPHQPRRRQKRRKASAKAGDSGCLSCCWVGFPPAPRFQLLTPTDSTAHATFYHFVPHLISKSFIVKQELDGSNPTPALILENTKACGLPIERPQGVAFTHLVLSLFFRLDFSCFPRLARIFLWKFAARLMRTAFCGNGKLLQ